MELPECYQHEYPGMVVRLNKAIYGLKNSPKLWNKTLVEFFASMGFKQTEIDTCLFIKHKRYDDNEHTIYIVVYVDDLILCSTSVELREEVRQKLKERFQMSQKVDNEPGGRVHGPIA